jgi:hypothetical protein
LSCPPFVGETCGCLEHGSRDVGLLN